MTKRIRQALVQVIRQLNREEENWKRMEGELNDPYWIKSQRTIYLTIAELREIRDALDALDR